MKDLQDFFGTLNSFFDKIYVITLERATDRHEHIRKELNGLHYEFFFGKDKQNFSVEDLKLKGIYNEDLAKEHHRYSKPMQEGQIGCAWSHAEVYKDVIEKSHQKVLILEDDVVVDKTSVKTFSKILEELPADWELLYLGFGERESVPSGWLFKKIFYHFLRSFKAVKYSHTTINHLYPKKISENIYEAGYHDCTHAYAITQSGAKKLLELQQPVSFIADNLLAHAVTNKIVNGYFIFPKLINQQYQLGISSASYLNN
jgi:glycosyl transferase family 25